MKLILVCFLLTGCVGNCDQVHAQVTGYTDRCVDGVTYLIFPQSVTLKYTIDGKLVPCK